MVYIYFLGVPGHLFTENAFMERDPRASKNPLGSFQLHGYSSYGRVKFQFSMKDAWEGRPKTAISCDFWHFSNFDVFLKGKFRGTKTPSGTSQTAVVPEIWPPEVSISLENIREGRTKIVIFSNSGFQTPWKPKIAHKKAPATLVV